MKRSRSDSISSEDFSMDGDNDFDYSQPTAHGTNGDTDRNAYNEDNFRNSKSLPTINIKSPQQHKNIAQTKKTRFDNSNGNNDSLHTRDSKGNYKVKGARAQMKNLFYEEDEIEQILFSQDHSQQQHHHQQQQQHDEFGISQGDVLDQYSLGNSPPLPSWSTPPRPSSTRRTSASVMRHEVKKITQEDRERAHRMVAQERKRWEKQFLHKTADPTIRDTYNTFASLQSLAQGHNMNFDTPEVVIVGMQSDGKSSFIEALLGFQFNAVDTQIGTRRPLLLQMNNNKDYVDEPLCTFMREDFTGWEDRSTPAKELEREIRRRTEERCGPTDVSSVPIIIQVQYAYCSNLNIYDTPGFRKGKDDPLKPRIAKMNQKLLSDKNRLIVCLEQSTVEWCNTQIRPIIRSVDPNFERTIFIATKFGNRVNQFKSEAEINGYLSTDGCLPNVERVFYMSLPSGVEARSLDDPREYQRAIMETYLSDYETLCKIGFDYRRFRKQIGFMRVQQFLEQELFRSYQRSVSPMIGRITASIERRQTFLVRLGEQIEQMEREDVERTINNMLYDYMRLIHAAIRGTNDFDAAINGMTLEEERSKSNHGSWPNFSLDIPFLNAQYKLYGGAQIMRLLAEFEIVAHSQECPPMSDDEVAVTIGLSGLHTCTSPENGASDLAQKKCRIALRPLLEILIERYRFIAKHTIGIIIDHMTKQQQQKHNEQSTNMGNADLELGLTQENKDEDDDKDEEKTESGNSKDSMEQEGKPQFQGFFRELQRLSNVFIDEMLRTVRSLSADEFDTFTRIIDWDMIANCNRGQWSDYNLLEPTAEDTKQRVASIIQSPEVDDTFREIQSDRSREMSEERCRKVKLMAAKLFGGVRLMFVKYMRAKFNAFFVDPIFNDMDEFLREHFRKLGSDQLKELAGLHIQKLKQGREKCAKYIVKAQELKEQFEKLQQKISHIVVATAERQQQ